VETCILDTEPDTEAPLAEVQIVAPYVGSIVAGVRTAHLWERLARGAGFGLALFASAIV
jgi:hypothetical protein